MKQIFIFFLLFQGLHTWAQTQSMPLPVVKQGKWFLIDGQREIKLPDSYSGVGLFDQRGTTHFSQNNRYGVLGRNGNELIPAKYFSVVPLGNGYYECTSSAGMQLLYAGEKGIEEAPFDSIVPLAPSWTYCEKDSSRFLLHTVSQKIIPLVEKERVLNGRFDYVLVYKDDKHISLYDPKGNMISEDSAYFTGTQFYAEYQTAKLHLIIDDKGTLELSPKATGVWVSEDRIHYSTGGKAFLLDRESRTVLVSVQGESIEVFDDRHYGIRRNGMLGLTDKTGKIVLQPQYDYIWKGNDFYRVAQKNKAGLIDLNFRTIVPCNYKYLSVDQSFIHTYSIVDGAGLISRITGEELLKPMYEKIYVESPLIKAWAGGNLSVLEISPQHQVKSKFMLDNAITLRSRTSGPNTVREKIDYRLFALGWFCDSIFHYDSLKSFTKITYKWGLKTASDSILIQPKLNQPLFVAGAPVSLLKGPRERVKAAGTWGQVATDYDEEVNTFSMINYSTGKRVPNLRVVDLDSTDFLRRGYSRFTHAGGNAILKSDGKIVNILHIDHTEEEFLRVCYRGTAHYLDKEDEQMVEITSRWFNSPAYRFWVKSGEKDYCFIKYENARWNFLDKEGNALFKDSFAFAQPFYKQTAIVKSEAGWGLARKDSVVIPMEYTSIKRVKEYNDTVFRVMLTLPGKVYFDTLLQPLSLISGRFEKQAGNLSMYTSKAGTKIYSRDYALALETNKNCSLYGFDRFTVKNKRIYEIHDADGKSLGESEAKPDDFLDEEFFLAGSTGKVGLMSVSGDTVAPFIFNSIMKEGNMFIAQNKSITNLYSANGTLIKSAPLTTILVDPASGNRAEIAEGKVTFFDAAGNKTGKLKSELRFEHYVNGFLFSLQDNCTILKADGTEILAEEAFSEIMFLQNGFCALHHTDKKWLIFDASWKPVAPEIIGIRKIVGLGDNVVSLQTKNECVLLDLETGEAHKGFAKISGTWQNGLLLVSTDFKKFRWSYINRNFEDPFKRTFSRAKPFMNGYACVADANGWTIIGTNGLPKSLSSYGDLEQSGHRIFRMSMLPVYGLIDSHGNAILEPVYEKITLLPDNLIQVIKDGQIGYFDYRGKVIYPIGK